MSRRRKPRVVKAPMAVASDGSILINVAASAGPHDTVKLVERAVAEGCPIFAGVTVSAQERRLVLTHLDDATAEIASWIFGGRHRHRRKVARGRARK
jgi:hypothetical protein